MIIFTIPATILLMLAAFLVGFIIGGAIVFQKATGK
jgi:hypothetical protein